MPRQTGIRHGPHGPDMTINYLMIKSARWRRVSVGCLSNLHYVDVAPVFRMLTDDLVRPWRPGRIPEKDVQFCVARQLLDGLVGTRYPPKIPHSVASAGEKDFG